MCLRAYIAIGTHYPAELTMEKEVDAKEVCRYCGKIFMAVNGSVHTAENNVLTVQVSKPAKVA